MKPYKPNRKKFVKFEKRHVLTDVDMKVLFDGFNEVFFAGRINKAVQIHLVPASALRKINKYHEADAAWRPATNEIWIDRIYARSESIAGLLLLHEMAHAVLEGTYVGHPTHNPGHGMIYQAELFRLFMAGAYDGLL